MVHEGGRTFACKSAARAGGLLARDSIVGSVFVHRLGGPCGCGVQHGEGGAIVPVAKSDTSSRPQGHPEAEGWTFRSPIPDGAPPPPWEAPGRRRPEAVYVWTDAQGRPCFYTVRYSWNEDGKRHKVVTPRSCWERADGSLGWFKAAPPSWWRRPLHNLPAIAANPGAPILAVEGEKAALAAALKVPDMILTTWSGGSGAVALTDWGPVARHPVTIWPDNDEAGAKAALAVAAACRAAGAVSARIVRLPPGLPLGFDLADEFPKGLEVPSWPT